MIACSQQWFSGTSTNNTDYSAGSVSIVIPAGQTSGSITLTGINDLTNEGNETIVVDVTSVTNGTESGTQSVTATIIDDDLTPPTVSIQIVDNSLAENGGQNTVVATLSNPAGSAIIVNLTFGGTATNNVDYSASANTIVILAGQTSGSITLTGINDTLSENAESIVVDITSVSGAGATENGVQRVSTNIGDVLTTATATNTPNRVADRNRYNFTGQTLTIHGTPAVDDIKLIRSGVSQFYTFFNGEVLVFSTTAINQVVIVAEESTDIFGYYALASIVENVTMNPASFAVSASGLSVQADGEIQYIYGQANDTATLGDSATDDVYYVRSEYGYLFDRANTYISEPIGFGTITTNASGGTDQVIMLGDGGDQTFDMTPTQTSMTNNGVTLIANNFEWQVSLGQGGNDTANLLGSAGNDVYTRKASPATRTTSLPATSILIVGSTFEQVFDMTTVNVQTGGGADIAVLNDSAGDDVFVGTPNEASLQTPYSLDRVIGFRGVYAFGSTGNDTATLDGSSGTDLFQGTATSSVLYRSGVFTLQADAFDFVHANLLTGAGGTDTATLIDSAGDDMLTSLPSTSPSNFAELRYAGGSLVRVTAFDAVIARGTSGGANRRTMSSRQTYTLTYIGSWI